MMYPQLLLELVRLDDDEQYAHLIAETERIQDV